MMTLLYVNVVIIDDSIMYNPYVFIKNSKINMICTVFRFFFNNHQRNNALHEQG